MSLKCILRLAHHGLKRALISPNVVISRSVHMRANSTAASALTQDQKPLIHSAVPLGAHGAKIIFNDDQTCDFKYIWLRDNCKCDACVHPETSQKIVDSPMLDTTIKPRTLEVTADGDLLIDWPAVAGAWEHRSIYGAAWLHKHGQCFARDAFDVNEEHVHVRPPLELWDRTAIWKRFPDVSYHELMQSDEGLFRWLDMLHKHGIAIIRGVPTNSNEIINVVKRFAYVKETSYGITFDVISEPDPNAHLAYTGRRLELHTDMNYREKSPGLQLLHCLKSESGDEAGGKSFFVDGFYAAKWLQVNQPAAFHVLSSTPVKFSIRNRNLKYSQHWPIVCVNKDGDVVEIHYNNRTMGTLQVPSHLVLPFYHAYRLLTEKLRDSSLEFVFHLVPGDLVAFNNRRVLHGRTGFDPMQVSRHLKGCYVDIDEAFSVYDHLMTKSDPSTRD